VKQPDGEPPFGEQPVFKQVVEQVEGKQRPQRFKPVGVVNERTGGRRAVTALHKGGNGHGKRQC